MTCTEAAKNRDLCVPLYRAALKGDWKAANKIINEELSIVGASIALGSYTALHVAAGAGHVHFVEKLVNTMSLDDVRLLDERGNTAFCVAAAAGHVKIAKIMMRKDSELPKQLGFERKTPLYHAASFGQQKMAWHLYSNMSSEENLPRLFFTCINSGLYQWRRHLGTSLASKLLEDHPDFAFERDLNGNTALHLLARKTSSFPSGSPGICAKLKRYKNPEQALVKVLWHEVAKQGRERLVEVLTSPSHLLFDAMEVGNCKFVAQLIYEFPGLVWEKNSRGWTIIHAAVWHRHETIFSLIYELGMAKDVIPTFKDTVDGNTLLHLAARLPPPTQLNRLAGAGFQMQRELLWFKEVKNIIRPSYMQKKNSDCKTPQEVFTSAHAPLLKDGQAWMNGTAQSCTIVSTLIASALFAAEVTVLMGDHPVKTAPFRIFIISDAIAFLLALAATLTFSAILTSRYAERDFLSALSWRLKMGLALLFFSITAMMFTFSSAFFIAYGRKDVFSILVTGCAGVPVLLYVFLQFPLLTDIFVSTFSCTSIFKQSEPVVL
ncbi:unnamed protein product [Prunus brigantina]